MTAGPVALPRVHVTIPAYGDDAYLREAVSSVLRQDVGSWRLTVLDDGPDDPALVEWFASLGDDRVEYRHNPVRLGINRNFQQCLDVAAEPWVVLLGADDRLLPSYVRVVGETAAAHPRAWWIQPAVRVVDAAGEPVEPLGDRVKTRLAPTTGPGDVTLIGGQELARSILVGNWMYFPAVAFRTDAVRRHGFREGYDVVQDVDLYLRMLLDGAWAAYPGDVAMEYRRHAASLSSTEALTGGRFDEERAFYREAAEQLAAAGWPRAARAARVRATSRLHALTALPRTRDLGTAGRLLRHAAGR